MITKTVKLTDISRQKEEIDLAGRMLRDGALVAFPTETVYGLAANVFDENACRRLYEVKSRPFDKPLTIHVADFSGFLAVAGQVAPFAMRIARRFLPGALTIIVPKAQNIPDYITGGTDSVGIRMPASPVAASIISSAGVPIVATSANISGHNPPVTAADVLLELDGKIPLVIDGGQTEFGVSSTVIDCTGDDFVVLREGTITATDISHAKDSESL